MAAYGGGIEPGTSEIASAVARGVHGCYKFEGIKRHRNGDLHMTSTRFDEPRALAMAATARSVLAIHGEGSAQQSVLIGGLDQTAQSRLGSSLKAAGFVLGRGPIPSGAGAAALNICNRGGRRRGVQIELSLGLRRACFLSISAVGRQTTTATFARLVAAIRDGLHGPAARQAHGADAAAGRSRVPSTAQ